MTPVEVAQWISYRNKRGSLNSGRRVEQSIGMLIARYLESKSKAGTEIDARVFMPHEDYEPVNDDIFDFDD